MAEIDAFDLEVIRTEVTDYFNELYVPKFPSLKSFRAMSERDLIPIIRTETEAMLATLLTMKQPKRILEIGTAVGYSATFFALEVPDAIIYTIEKDETVLEAARHNFVNAGIQDRVHPLCGDGIEQLEALNQQGIGDFDMVFIDAAKSHYLAFLERSLPLCRDGALILSDNILQHGMTVFEERDTRGKHKTNIRNMREYLHVLTHSEEFTTNLLPIGDGLGISVYHKTN